MIVWWHRHHWAPTKSFYKQGWFLEKWMAEPQVRWQRFADFLLNYRERSKKIHLNIVKQCLLMHVCRISIESPSLSSQRHDINDRRPSIVYPTARASQNTPAHVYFTVPSKILTLCYESLSHVLSLMWALGRVFERVSINAQVAVWVWWWAGFNPYAKELPLSVVITIPASQKCLRQDVLYNPALKYNDFTRLLV